MSSTECSDLETVMTSSTASAAVTVLSANVSSGSGSPSSVSDPLFVVSLVLMVTLTVWVISVNTLIVVVLLLSPQLKKKMYIFIGSLAVSDLFAGVTAPVAFSLQLGPVELSGGYICVTVYILLILPMLVSILNLLAVACDRYVAIVHPLKYEAWVTAARARFLIAFTWVYSLAVVAIPYGWRRKYSRCILSVLPTDYMFCAVCLHYAIFVTFMAFLYGRIYIEARLQQRRIQDAEGNVLGRTAVKKHAKATKLVVLILGVFCLCWTPLVIFFAARYVDIEMAPTEMGDYTFLLAFSNSGMNFVIYSARNAEFRRALVAVFRRRPTGNVHPQHSEPQNVVFT